MTQPSTSKPKRATPARRARTAADGPIIDTRLTPTACPLAPDWPARLRQMQFVFADRALQDRLKAAHQTELGARLVTRVTEWQVAADDHSEETPAGDSHVTPGFPCHLHMGFSVGGQRVHLDRTWANLWGPGRLKEEWHIFVDGALAGLGGQMGCSLGLTIAIWPAVARLNGGLALAVPWPAHTNGVGREAVLAAPGVVEVVEVKLAGLRKP